MSMCHWNVANPFITICILKSVKLQLSRRETIRPRLLFDLYQTKRLVLFGCEIQDNVDFTIVCRGSENNTTLGCLARLSTIVNLVLVTWRWLWNVFANITFRRNKLLSLIQQLFNYLWNMKNYLPCGHETHFLPHPVLMHLHSLCSPGLSIHFWSQKSSHGTSTQVSLPRESKTWPLN